MDTCSHQILKKAWNGRAVCEHLHADRIAEVQISLLTDTPKKKELLNYHPALATILDSLSGKEQEHCEHLAVNWNKTQLPEDVQRKYVYCRT